MFDLKILGTQSVMDYDLPIIELNINNKNERLISLVDLGKFINYHTNHLNYHLQRLTHEGTLYENIDYVELKNNGYTREYCKLYLNIPACNYGKCKNLYLVTKKCCEIISSRLTDDSKINLINNLCNSYYFNTNLNKDTNTTSNKLKNVADNQSTVKTNKVKNLFFIKDNKIVTTSRLIFDVMSDLDYNISSHRDLARYIRNEIKKLNALNTSDKYQLILDDFKQITYKSNNGQSYTAYELGPLALLQILEYFNTYARATIITELNRLNSISLNVFKATLIEELLPQDHKLKQYMYVIRNPLNDTIKIDVGHSQDINNKLEQLKSTTGIDYELLYKFIVCSDKFNIEQDIYSHLQQYKTFGDWLNINQDVLINFLDNQINLLRCNYDTKSIIHHYKLKPLI